MILALVASLLLALHSPAVAATVPAPATIVAEQRVMDKVATVYNVPRPWTDRSREAGGRITDSARYFDAEEKFRIFNKIRDVEERTGSMVVVVTVNSIGLRSPKNFATALFNHWAIGSKERNNGVLILIVRDSRRVEIEVGKRLNHIVSNSWTTGMLQQSVLPKLRVGDYAEGVEAAVERVGRRMEQPISSKSSDSESFTFLIAGTYLSVSAYTSYWNWRKERRCMKCGSISDGFTRCSKWKTVETATDLKEGRKERKIKCELCGQTTTRSKAIKRYDGKKRDRKSVV